MPCARLSLRSNTDEARGPHRASRACNVPIFFAIHSNGPLYVSCHPALQYHSLYTSCSEWQCHFSRTPTNATTLPSIPIPCCAQNLILKERTWNFWRDLFSPTTLEVERVGSKTNERGRERTEDAKSHTKLANEKRCNQGLRQRSETSFHGNAGWNLCFRSFQQKMDNIPNFWLISQMLGTVLTNTTPTNPENELNAVEPFAPLTARMMREGGTNVPPFQYRASLRFFLFSFFQIQIFVSPKKLEPFAWFSLISVHLRAILKNSFFLRYH